MAGIKIAITGSNYEASIVRINQILDNVDVLPITEIMLVDFDRGIAGKLVEEYQQLSKPRSSSCLVSVTRNAVDGYGDADFVIFQQPDIDTKNTLDLLSKCIQHMESYCKEAWLIAVGDSLGSILEIAMKQSTIKIVGVSDLPYKAFQVIRHYFGEDATIEYMGINKHGFITSIKDGGGMERIHTMIYPKTGSKLYEDSINLISLEYIREINAITLKHLMDLYVINAHEILEDENVLCEVIYSLYYNIRSIQIVTTVNNGALKFLEEHELVETMALVSGEGIIPFSIEVVENHIVSEQLKKIKARN
jgi:alpha-galactosidase/6-phospho-beta-glucosidase family protein